MVELLAIKKLVKLRGPGGEIVEVPALVPAYSSQVEAFRALSAGKIIAAKITVPRNTALHRKFFALANYTFDNLPETYDMKNIDQFIDWIKFSAAYVDTYKVNGSVRVRPKSMSFSSADEVTFQKEFYNPAIGIMADILGMTIEDLETASLTYDGPDYRNQRK